MKTKAVLLTVVVVSAIAAAAFVWWRMRGGDCRTFADKVCALSKGSCDDVKMVFEARGLSAERCRDGTKLLEGIEKQPPGLRAALIGSAFAEAVGAETMFRATHDAMMLMMDMDFVASQNRPTDEMLKRLRDIGPQACRPLIGRLGEKETAAHREMAHKVLVEIRGQDLGTDPAAWKGWCNDVFKESLQRK